MKIIFHKVILVFQVIVGELIQLLGEDVSDVETKNSSGDVLTSAFIKSGLWN